LAIAVIGVSNLAESIGFYRGIVGLDVVAQGPWRGLAFARHWRVAPQTNATAVLLQGGRHTVGRILLLDFKDARRQVVRDAQQRNIVGLLNLNFYVRDVAAAHRDLVAKGYEFWWPPRTHQLSKGVGSETGALLEGPDGVIINLIQLDTEDESTRIGQTRKFFLTAGATRTGFSPVVTSAHGVRDRERALSFATEVLQQAVVIDEPLGPPEQRTHWTFLQGAHRFGKVALAQALNYQPADLVARAVPPNVGYLAQSFEVPDFDRALAACRRIGVSFFSPPDELTIPGLGPRRVAMAHNPGSGALQQLIAAV
jgi:catechol 2,3-dioxygenase-like lactoylglutathione lyase family enzyme